MSNLELINACNNLQAIVNEKEDDIIDKDNQLSESNRQLIRYKSRELFLLLVLAVCFSVSLVFHWKVESQKSIWSSRFKEEEKISHSLELQLKEAASKIKEYNNIIDVMKSNETSSSLMIKKLLYMYEEEKRRGSSLEMQLKEIDSYYIRLGTASFDSVSSEELDVQEEVSTENDDLNIESCYEVAVPTSEVVLFRQDLRESSTIELYCHCVVPFTVVILCLLMISGKDKKVPKSDSLYNAVAAASLYAPRITNIVTPINLPSAPNFRKARTSNDLDSPYCQDLHAEEPVIVTASSKSDGDIQHHNNSSRVSSSPQLQINRNNMQSLDTKNSENCDNSSDDYMDYKSPKK